MVMFCMDGLSGRQTNIDSRFWRGGSVSTSAKGSSFFGLEVSD